MDYKLEQAKTKEALKPKMLQRNFGSSRSQYRARIVNRKFTKKGYAFGRKIGSKEDNLIEHIAKRQKVIQ